MVTIYIQLIIGNVMRHDQAGLAIPDFPTMGWTFFPTFDTAWLNRINEWRFENNLDPVNMAQVMIHLLHRCWAFLILLEILMAQQCGLQRMFRPAAHHEDLVLA